MGQPRPSRFADYSVPVRNREEKRKGSQGVVTGVTEEEWQEIVTRMEGTVARNGPWDGLEPNFRAKRPEAPLQFVELVSSMNRKGASFATASGGESSNWPAAAG